MLIEFLTIIILALTGELIVALPVAIALGFDPIEALFIVIATNIAPAFPIFKFFDLLDKRGNRIIKFFTKRGEYLKNRASNLIDILVLITTPIFGVYAISCILAFMKFPSFKGIILQLLSLFIWGIVMILGYQFLMKIF